MNIDYDYNEHAESQNISTSQDLRQQTKRRGIGLVTLTYSSNKYSRLVYSKSKTAPQQCFEYQEDYDYNEHDEFHNILSQSPDLREQTKRGGSALIILL